METVDATIEKVEQTGDWFSVFTNDPTVKKLTTMREDLAGQAASFRLKGIRGRIKFTPKQRQAADGRVWQNYYFEGVEELPAEAASNGSGIDGIDRPAPTTRKTDPEDAWRMALSVGAKLAVETMPLMPPDARDFGTQKRIALAWADFIVGTPRDFEDEGIPFGQAPAGGGPDSDIPY